ncbi:3-oxoadipate enol-lactonase [Novosphingobium sp. KCTC 2891]|uniref:3-oxoadipate enol-lactonase n=1 Tax=Novosphingobium sp. KCTC 2891 TaxID=2989730 RepID=UPI00222210E3|nr:3-oxoadipate enol-lactonase [Novosphingobium sp. KCTC 2891]MCW1384095.1 3-oxoadipate enol-lactonase [Novosphingobium sp. KCTC 2891]
MPFVHSRGARIHWKLEGEGGAPALVLLNSIGTDMDLWDPLLPALRARHALLRIDTLGHGASDAPEGDYAMAELADDVFAAMDAAGIQRAAVAGVSLGGMIAMEMALAQPGRVERVALVCTSATMDRAAWQARVEMVREQGMAAIAGLAMGRFLSPGFIAAQPAVAATIRRQLLSMDPAGYAGCAAAIRDMDLADRIAAIACPALVVTGNEDTSTPWTGHGEHLAGRIPGARHVALPAAHLATLEAPQALAEALTSFLDD